jgi:hypothetical protein
MTVPIPGAEADLYREEGIPRFVEDGEEISLSPEEGDTLSVALKPWSEDEGQRKILEEPEADLQEYDEQEQQEEDEERQRDIRQELKEYLDGVRRKLEEREAAEKEPASEEELEELGDAHAEQRESGDTALAENVQSLPPSGLVEYLEELTAYLPEDEKASFQHSDARLKMEYLKSKLEGRAGITKQIETVYPPEREPTLENEGLTTAKLAETFSYMKSLTSFYPDQSIGDMMQSKIDGILYKMRGEVV